MAKTKNGIVYPDNYDKVADVPADLKELAESVDEVIENNKTEMKKSNETRDGKISKNTENIEAIQGSIKTAIETINKKDNEQDEDIKANKETIKEIQAENERLREDIKSIATIGEASGENIHIEDSSNSRCEIEIGGNQKQETREGYNLLILPASKTENGITFTTNEDGSVTANGTATADASINFVNKEGSPSLSFEAGTYRLTGCPQGGSSTTYRMGMNLSYNSCDIGDGVTQTIDTAVTNKNVWLIVYSGTTVSNLTFYPMLIKGTENKPYEQYGASPSLDYPSKVKSVGDNINMLFTNPDDWEQGTITDGANASSMTRIRTKNFIDIIDNEDYYVSISNTQYCFLNIVLYKEDKTYIGQYYSLNNAINGANHLKINLPTDAKKIRVIIRNLDNVSDISPSDIEMIKPKLEKSSVATPYSSYNCGSLKTKIGNKNHLSTIPRVTFSLQGIQTTFDGEKFTCKGTAMYNYFNLVTQRIQQHFKAGTYTFSSNMFEKGRACIRFYYEDGTADTYYSNINTKKISFTLKKDAYAYFLMVDGLTVGGGDVIDCIIKLQLEDGNTSTEIVKAENQEFVVDVQQPLLEGDTFVRQDGKWYEKHNWKTMSFDGQNMASQAGGNFADFKENGNIARVFEIKDLLISSIRNDIFCDKLPRQADSMWNGKSTGIQSWQGQNKILISLPFDDVEKKYGQKLTVDNYVTAFYMCLQDEVPIISYPLAEPELIECTETQSKVLDEIYNKAHTYKNITNISAESSEVNPIASVKYLKDPETEHNKLQVQIDEIKQLLSSTETSAMLLNNMQTDLESEV